MTIFHLDCVCLQLLPIDFINFLQKIMVTVNTSHGEEGGGLEIFCTIDIEEGHPQFFRSIWEFVGEHECIHPMSDKQN